MRIENRTRYDTRDLKKIFSECCKRWGYPTNKEITVKYRRRHISNNGVSGYAWFNTRRIVIIVGSRELDTERLAQVFLHECQHNAGVREHKDMKSSGSIDCEWAKEMTVRIVEPKAVKKDIVKERYERVKKLLCKHTATFKREQRLVRKYHEKVRYYEKKLSGGKASEDSKRLDEPEEHHSSDLQEGH